MAVVERCQNAVHHGPWAVLVAKNTQHNIRRSKYYDCILHCIVGNNNTIPGVNVVIITGLNDHLVHGDVEPLVTAGQLPGTKKKYIRTFLVRTVSDSLTSTTWT